MAVGQRKDQRLIDPQRLAELEERAQDGIDMREALNSLKAKHYYAMEMVREAQHPSAVNMEQNYYRGWLQFETDLGDALLGIRKRREGDLPDEDTPF